MSLNDILGRLIEEYEPAFSSIQMHAAIKAGWAMVLQDREITIYLIDEGLGRHLAHKSTRTLGGGRKDKSARDAPGRPTCLKSSACARAMSLTTRTATSSAPTG